MKKAADLKGKRLSAAGGGVGGFNWRMGREVLKSAGLSVDDAQFISSALAGRLPGLVAGQVDGVALHPEDVYLAKQQKPELNLLVQLVDLMPLYMFNGYGASTEWIARDRALLRDTAAAMIEANRTIYREKDKVIPIMVEATQKSKEAVEYAWEVLTKNCVWSVNDGFDPKRTEWSINSSVENGDVDAATKPTVEQVINMQLAGEAVEAAGGRVNIGNCTDSRPRQEIDHHGRQTAADRPAALGTGPQQARPGASLRQYARHALLPGCGLRAVLEGRICPPLCRAAGEDAGGKLDCMIVPGGPSHWSFGAGMLWLTGHWEWHALACYVLVPLEGEPTMIYSMGGTHAEAVRRQVAVAISDVRHSRNGRYAEVMVERLKELKLERARIGLMEIDQRHKDYMPVNQYNVLRDSLPDAELVFTVGFLHELLSVHSAEELDCVRKAGGLCQNALEALVARASPA